MKLFPLMMVAGIAVGATTGASAATTTFTWSPGGANPPLNGGDVTANNITIADFASATIDPVTNNFTETGALLVTAFSLTGVPQPATGLNSTYSLYMTFNATGNQGGPIPPSGSTITGSISSISYTLWAVPGAAPTFTVTNGNVGITNNGGAFALATGTGGGTGSDFVTLTNTGTAFIPGAQAVTSFIPCTGVGGDCTGDESGFFLAPPSNIVLDLEAAFTNTAGVSTLIPGNPIFLNIVGGGGNLDLAIVPTPEPTTLAILGVGLLGLGMLRRKQK